VLREDIGAGTVGGDLRNYPSRPLSRHGDKLGPSDQTVALPSISAQAEYSDFENREQHYFRTVEKANGAAELGRSPADPKATKLPQLGSSRTLSVPALANYDSLETQDNRQLSAAQRAYPLYEYTKR